MAADILEDYDLGNKLGFDRLPKCCPGCQTVRKVVKTSFPQVSRVLSNSEVICIYPFWLLP
jgi:hypothetical protein